MSNQIHLQFFRDQVANSIGQRLHSEPANKFASRSVAKSALQKSIRRGDIALALLSTRYLVEQDQAAFWRRLVIIALEDVGLGALDVVSQVIACAAQARARRQIADDFSVATYLVSEMCRSTKDRTTDELAVLAEYQPALERYRTEFANLPLRDLLGIIDDRSISLEELAIATWYAMGTDKYRSTCLADRAGDPIAFWSVLENAGVPQSLIEVCQVGLLRGRTILAAFLPISWLIAKNESQSVVADNLSSNQTINDLPGWVFGGHTQEGRRAIAVYLKSGSEMSRWLRRHAPNVSPTYVVDSLLFRVESGLVDKRLSWRTGDRLRQLVDRDIHRIDPNLATEALDIMRSELPLLDAARQQVVGFTSDNRHYRR